MPMLIKHIDAIARVKLRDVLYIEFERESLPTEKDTKNEGEYKSRRNSIDWEKIPVRQQIIDWLDISGIAWQPCGSFACTNSWKSYQGSIYIDVPYDVSLSEYKKLVEFLENPDGSMRLSNAIFCYLPLEQAMKNAHHDAPGFWEKQAEYF